MGAALPKRGVRWGAAAAALGLLALLAAAAAAAGRLWALAPPILCEHVQEFAIKKLYTVQFNVFDFFHLLCSAATLACFAGPFAAAAAARCCCWAAAGPLPFGGVAAGAAAAAGAASAVSLSEITSAWAFFVFLLINNCAYSRQD